MKRLMFIVLSVFLVWGLTFNLGYSCGIPGAKCQQSQGQSQGQHQQQGQTTTVTVDNTNTNSSSSSSSSKSDSRSSSSSKSLSEISGSGNSSSAASAQGGIAYGGSSSSSSSASVTHSGNSSISGSGNSSLYYYQEDKREHIRGPELLNSNPQVLHGKPLKIKTYGLDDFLANVEFLTKEEAEKLADKADDYTVKDAVFLDGEQESDVIKITNEGHGKYMGLVYVYPDGNDCNIVSMFGVAAYKACKLGATEIKLVKVDSQEVDTGKAINIGIGGGASFLSHGDKTAIAPNGGTGWGKASSSSEELPAIVVALYTSGTKVTYNYSKISNDVVSKVVTTDSEIR